jgi:asparagine synthase (glutamine-hydrolysing)
LKALRQFSGFAPEVDPGSVALLLRYKCIPAPHSIYSACSKVMPGTFVTFDKRLVEASTSYWSAREEAANGLAMGWAGSRMGAVDHLHELLLTAVKDRMVADVPLGAFLSGGIDSSTVVALMQAQSAEAVRTFTVGFEEEDFDEAPFAAAVARHLGTEHTEVRVPAAEMLAAVPRLPAIYDEPFADSSQLPTLLVSQVARNGVTEAMSYLAAIRGTSSPIGCGARRPSYRRSLVNGLRTSSSWSVG